MKSKLDSLQRIIEEVKPTIICLVETHLENEPIELEGYELYRNDRNNEGGGVLIGVSRQLENITVAVEKKKEIEESLWIVLDNTKIKLRIGVIYTPQESRTVKEQYKQMYESINEQILLAKEKEQNLVLLGDFNCKIGEEIKGNKKEVSKSGKNFMKMAKSLFTHRYSVTIYLTKWRR